ncbi:MarR family winged helix-turn-helix transcriptional regulator [Kitasatospora aureofaciens]|uniref:MarR family winged helix-turn-helix transcriptional regulator n=1 Tax=Kitasatospora aureofaciens TaxID=1894 RepID=UPI001C4614CE|nr:MarR family winged helix-turn-helix transcriptional regulator [Kitasatospora aureofaciens]MBV6695862.1 MarR family winged helix-turn-helix transcriptional regulator [Kitasatospora aureofaciens]
MTDLSPSAETLSDITTELFAVNGGLLRAGDALSARFGLTSARWQVLGLLHDGPQSAAHLARERGLRRQAVQQVVVKLVEEGLVSTSPNPADRRAPLVSLTAKGADALARIEPAERHWMEHLAGGLDPDDLKATLRLLRGLRAVLADGLPASATGGADAAGVTDPA